MFGVREGLKRLLRPVTRRLGIGVADEEYAKRIASEQQIFADQVEVHDLPQIYHYWSNKFLRPMLEPFGFTNPDELYALHLQRAHQAAKTRPARFVSLGCGNCDTEVRVAKMLVERGVTGFTIECVDINADMLARGREMAEREGVAAQIVTVCKDFNEWRGDQPYDAVIANQSLHHVVKLERLFVEIERALGPEGRFVTSDMIGRNGHMRWPEALAIVHEYWRELPEKYRFHRQLRRHEELYENWDCSKEGFEGIRAQDILPLLNERFDFELFLPFGNVIDTFIDRGFGPNFDHEGEWDRAFVDKVHARDEAEIRAGTIKPTHIMAVMRKRPYAGERHLRDGLTPEHCIRRPS